MSFLISIDDCVKITISAALCTGRFDENKKKKLSKKEIYKNIKDDGLRKKKFFFFLFYFYFFFFFLRGSEISFFLFVTVNILMLFTFHHTYR